MTVAVAIGNGISRKQLVLDQLKTIGTTYGCNALYRDFVPDCLVATDRPIAMTIENSGYAQQHRFYTRKPLPGSGARPIPDPYYGFSSGPIAIALAALDNHSRIYLVGFDMGPVGNNGFNNVYADSEFYRKSTSAPTYTGNWSKQMRQISKLFLDVQFIRVCGTTTATHKDLAGLPNLSHMSLKEFVDLIHNSDTVTV